MHLLFIRSMEEDFASIIKAEIQSKRRKLVEEQTALGKKYIKRGELQHGGIVEAKVEDITKAEVKENDILETDNDAIAADEKDLHKYHPDQRIEGEGSRKKSKEEAEIYNVSALQTDPIDTTADAAIVSPLILLLLKRLLHEQEEQLSRRSDEEKSSKEGKLATTFFSQSKESLRYLFKQIRKQKLPKDILKRLCEICAFLQQREYVRANDAYLKLAIGNAPWPIGVTAVGIHERSAQERIKSDQIARNLIAFPKKNKSHLQLTVCRCIE